MRVLGVEVWVRRRCRRGRRVGEGKGERGSLFVAGVVCERCLEAETNVSCSPWCRYRPCSQRKSSLAIRQKGLERRQKLKLCLHRYQILYKAEV